jgi:hypothetical protein
MATNNSNSNTNAQRQEGASDELINNIAQIQKAAKEAPKELINDIDQIKKAAKEHANEMSYMSLGDIILWKSPVHSTAVLACGILLFGLKFLLIHRYGYTIPTLLCRLCQLSIIIAGVVHAFTHRDLNAEQIREFADRAFNGVKAPLTNGVGIMCHVLQWVNKNTTFEALLLLQLASWLFNVLSISTVVFILFCTTMTVPALYELKRPAIEAFVQKERKQLNNRVAQICDSLPPALHAQLHKLGVVLPTAHKAAPEAAAQRQRKVQ